MSDGTLPVRLGGRVVDVHVWRVEVPGCARCGAPLSARTLTFGLEDGEVWIVCRSCATDVDRAALAGAEPVERDPRGA